MSDRRVQDILSLAMNMFVSAAASTPLTEDAEFKALARTCIRAARDFYEVVDTTP